MEKDQEISSKVLSRLIESIYPVLLSYADKTFPAIGTEVIQDLISESLTQLITKRSDISKVLTTGMENENKAEMESRFKSYLFASFKNRLISELRRTQYKSTSIDESVLAVADIAEEQWDSASKLHLMKKAMNLLSDADKEILSLFYFEGTSLNEIANKLGYSTVTVKNRKYRAMKKLRSILQTLDEKEVDSE